jgi:protein-S-isoprenylcysteine O-methyltransferase Ste14
MTAFCVAFFGILHAGVRWGFGIAPVSGSLRTALILVGLVLLALGTTVNVVGRAELGRNWANQATIYEDQTLVVDGLYGVVRHPLYASLLWMLTGVSLVYLNYAALAATMLVFLPMVSARARLEEDMLTKRFPEYDNYRQRVGRFLPCWRSA